MMLNQVFDTLSDMSANIFWTIGIALAVVFVVIIARKIYSIIETLKRETTLLELTPPAWSDKTPEATNQLFMSFYGLGSTRRFIERVLGKRDTFSLEIVATKSGGIRYLISCEKNQAQTIEHIIASYAPDIKVKRCDEYIGKISKNVRVLEFKQKSHFAYPLQLHDIPISHDPISYVTNAMTKLGADEHMAVQIVIRPTKSREADSLNHKIMTNDDLLPKLHKGQLPRLDIISSLFGSILFGAADLVSEMFHGSSKEAHQTQTKAHDYNQQVARRIKPARTLSFFEQEMVESISNKLSQPLFLADLRVLIDVRDRDDYASRRKNIESAFNLYSVAKYQRLALRTAKHYLMQKYTYFVFRHRLPAFIKSHSNTFAISEVASLYHFPHSQTAKTENVVKSLSKTLPAPISLKGNNKLDVLIGENVHQGVTTPIGLTEAERERHMYVIGGTGNGKTTLLLYGIVQDMQNGKGVAVIDPHGDLAETILRYVPEERIKDIIYLNPDDLAHPIGINLLELPLGLEGDELLREKDLVTESTISVLRKIFSEDDSGGHRIEYVLRNTIQTALTMDGATLFTIFHLLNDSKFRRDAVKQLKDEDLKNFWKNEIGKAGDFQRVKMAAGITAKIGRFLFSASAKRILEQEKSTINFDEILDSGKILICNFSKGMLGEDTSALFGTTVLAKLQVASLRRARIKQANRRPFYLYVDEFQNFATMSFVQMLSEARKYKLFLTMAEQSTSQQDQQRLVDIILANVGTVICFRSGSPSDEQYVLPLFSPYIEQGEIANLPAYNFYARISAVHSQEPMSGMTVVLQDAGSDMVANEVNELSASKYGAKTPDSPPAKTPGIESATHPHRTTRNKKTSQAIKKAKSINPDISPIA